MAICDSDAEDRAALDAILNLFPGLKVVEHELTSRPTRDYNCIAFAFGDVDCKWWPLPSRDTPLELIYWPRRCPREETFAAFKIVFESRGYFVCADSNFKDSFEKIALYCNARLEWRRTSATRRLKHWRARSTEKFLVISRGSSRRNLDAE